MSSTHESQAWDEFRRQRRLVDQLASMHASLANRYQACRTASLLLVMGLSVLGAGFAFAASGVTITLLGFDAARETWVGALALIVLGLSIADLVTDWAGRSRTHQAAVRDLAALKVAYREVRPSGGASVPPAGLTLRYNALMDTLPLIPERAFNSLKARHLRKVEISKVLSQHPGLSAWAAGRQVRERART
jgi:hypothetical protein